MRRRAARRISSLTRRLKKADSPHQRHRIRHRLTRATHRLAELKARRAARRGRGARREAIRNLGETIRTGGQAVWEGLRGNIQAGQQINQSRLQPTRTTVGALQGLTHLDPKLLAALTKNLRSARKETDAFARAQRFARNMISLSSKEIKDLGVRFKLLEAINKKTRGGVKASMEAMKTDIITAVQAGIDAVNSWYDNEKEKLDSNLQDQTDVVEKNRSKALDAEDKRSQDVIDVYNKQLEAIDNAETEITRTQERETRKRERIATQHQIGKLLSQEFFSQEDLDQIESLQTQLSDQLRSSAEAEAGYGREDARKKIEDDIKAEEKNHEDRVKAINDAADADLKKIETTYAQALLVITGQANAMIEQFIKSGAKALGISVEAFWDLLSVESNKPDSKNKKIGAEAGTVYASAFGESTKAVGGEAGKKMMEAFASGIDGASDLPINALKRVLKKLAKYLPDSDAELGPLSELTSSGESVWKTFAEGMDKAAATISFEPPPAFENLTLAAPSINANIVGAEKTMRLVHEHNHKLEIDARGLTDAEKAELIDKFSKELARASRQETMTARDPARSLI